MANGRQGTGLLPREAGLHAGCVSYSGPHSGDEVRLWKYRFSYTTHSEGTSVAGDLPLCSTGTRGVNRAFCAYSCSSQPKWIGMRQAANEPTQSGMNCTRAHLRDALRYARIYAASRNTTLLKPDATLPKKRHSAEL